MGNFKYYRSYSKPSIENMVTLYDDKMKEVKAFLKENFEDENHWNIAYASQEREEVFYKIYDEFIKSKDIRCTSELEDSFRIIIEKYNNTFSIIDEEADNNLEKYEQYFDTLCEMPLSIYEYINNNIDCSCPLNISENNVNRIMLENLDTKFLDTNFDIYKSVSIIAPNEFIEEDDYFYLAA